MACVCLQEGYLVLDQRIRPKDGEPEDENVWLRFNPLMMLWKRCKREEERRGLAVKTAYVSIFHGGESVR